MVPPAPPETLSAMGSGSGKFKRGIRQLRNAPHSWMLIRILVIVQAVPVIWDKIVPTPPGIADKLSQAQALLGLKKAAFLSGDIWQIGTHALIHVNWAHLLLNGAAILLLGSKIEHIAGKRVFWLLALAAALAGGLTFLLFTPPGLAPAAQHTLVGSSAICFAFFILLTTLSPESKFLPLFLSGRSLGVAIILANLILSLIHPNLHHGPFVHFGIYLEEHGLAELFLISHPCHLGGSVAGYVCGKYLLRPRVTIASLKREREKREATAKR
ncbi:MAG: rhomboid family intramembrane serine protease [Luteolibacter sp.]